MNYYGRPTDFLHHWERVQSRANPARVRGCGAEERGGEPGSEWQTLRQSRPGHRLLVQRDRLHCLPLRAHWAGQYFHHFTSLHQFLSNSKCIALFALSVLTCLPDILIFTFYLGQNSETQPSTGLLPLVFGLPFAQEISSFDFRSSPALALVSQNVITYWSNFAHSG